MVGGFGGVTGAAFPASSSFFDSWFLRVGGGRMVGGFDGKTGAACRASSSFVAFWFIGGFGGKPFQGGSMEVVGAKALRCKEAAPAGAVVGAKALETPRG